VQLAAAAGQAYHQTVPGHGSTSLIGAPGAVGSCELRGHERAAELRLEGELDLAAVTELDHAVAMALYNARIDVLEVDVAAVTFIDSSVLNWLIRTDRRARAAGARLVLSVAPGCVRDRLRMTGLEGRFRLLDAT
jgi:anti-sigma B factor antagonist